MSERDLELSEAVRLGCIQLGCHDSRLKALIVKFGQPTLRLGGDPYQALVRTIVFQQISGKAASAIFGRFLQLFPGSEFPLPEVLANADISTLRRVGLSQRKAEYVVAIAQAFLDPNFLGREIRELSEAEVSTKLTSIRGVGQWTADMFMIFTLGRLDVLPLGDQGIKNGIQLFFELENSPTDAEMLQLTRLWKPYRSIASWYMWKLVDEGFDFT